MRNLLIEAMSREAAWFYAIQRHNEKSVIISINGVYEADNAIQARKDWNNIQDILFLHFEDVEDDRGINPEQAIEIVNFYLKWRDKVDKVIIHCHAGQSRSVGCARALAKIEFGNDSAMKAKYRNFPNERVYNFVLEAYNRISKDAK